MIKVMCGRSLYFLLFLSILLILSSCARSKTTTITPLAQSNRSKINKIAIFVEADEEFNVSVSKEKERYYSSIPDLGYLDCNSGESLGAAASCGFVFIAKLIGTAIGAAIEEPIRYHVDEKHEDSLEAKLTHFHPGELMTEKLQNYLELSNADFTAEIPEVNSPSMLKAERFDSILEVNLKEWEFKLCSKNSWSALDPEEREILNQWSKYEHKVESAGQFLYGEDALDFTQEELEEIERLRPLARKFRGDKARTQIKLSARMILIDDNSTVWEREESYRDENCYWLEDLKTQPELLVDILTRAINNLAKNTVNEIL